MSKNTGPARSGENEKKDCEPQWPLPFQIQTQSRRWWSHNLYRGPGGKAVQVYYSKTRERSEALAKLFLHEPVVGFDMEWPWNSQKHHQLQQKIGLIQVACEDKVALFHIGLHPGKTTDEIIAPSLKTLIESVNITKTGVGILNVDFERLKKYFGLKPQGAFELSHLHRLVKFGKKPELLTTKLTALAQLVEEHLRLPLYKGEVRTSNWSRPLTQQQINYAANDAYAGFMLFHCMNAKRAELNPIPPLPILAERYPALPSDRRAPITSLRLHPLQDGEDAIIAAEFFKPSEEAEDNTEEGIGKRGELVGKENTAIAVTKKKAQAPQAKDGVESLDSLSKALYKQLLLRRKALAKQQNLPLYRIAHNSVLEGLARQRPLNDDDLLKVKGIGLQQRDRYGAEWLEVIAHFLAAKDIGAVNDGSVGAPPLYLKPQSGPPPATPYRRGRQREVRSEGSSSSSPAFGTPVQRAPQLHTGLSFSLAETQLNDEEESLNQQPSPTVAHCSTHTGSNYDVLTLFHEQEPQARADEASEDAQRVSSGQNSPPITPDSRPSSLKRKRSAISGEPQQLTPSKVSSAAASLTPRTRIFRNKLLAFSRLVASKLKSGRPDTGPVVSEAILDQIVAISPRTLEELRTIQGIESFAQACKDAGMDLLRNIIKLAPARC